MKIFIGLVVVVSLVACSPSRRSDSSEVSAVQGSSLKGYVGQDHRRAPYFVAVDSRTRTVTAALPMATYFSKKDDAAIASCMLKKTTHAIVLDEKPATQANIPSDIPGVPTTSHMPVYGNVRCVAAPGFYNEWRTILQESPFNP